MAIACPECVEDQRDVLNLVRHMVESDRPDGPHQVWLSEALGLPFAEYAFGKDAKIAQLFQVFMRETRRAGLPQDPEDFNEWLDRRRQ